VKMSFPRVNVDVDDDTRECGDNMRDDGGEEKEDAPANKVWRYFIF
jgi:hypothetical protein